MTVNASLSAGPGLNAGSSRLRLAVDLDETIFATVDYWITKLLREFPIDEQLSASELVAKYRYAQNVPEWRDHPKALQRMQEFREDPAFHLEIPVIPYSPQALGNLSRSLDIYYLTMRPPVVEHATGMAILTNGFPTGDLRFCPRDIPMAEKPNWKASVLVEEFPSLVGIVEDHPAVVDSLPNDYGGTVFYFSQRPHHRNDIKVIQCSTWLDVETAVRQELPRLLNLQRPISP